MPVGRAHCTLLTRASPPQRPVCRTQSKSIMTVVLIRKCLFSTFYMEMFCAANELFDAGEAGGEVDEDT